MLDLSPKFQQRVLQDVKDFGIDSVYIPNPIFTEKPLFALIGMESATGGKGVKEVAKNVNEGFKNFLTSEQDFILHYCAYTYLCKGQFQYLITDISKGAMLTKLASKYRHRRYQAWCPLLKEELSAFSRPPIAIAIGIGTRHQLNKLGFPVEHYVRHYSSQLSGYYNTRAPEDWQADTVHISLKDFARKLLGLKDVGYTDDMQKRKLDKVFTRHLSRWKHGLLAEYTKVFKDIRKKYPDA